MSERRSRALCGSCGQPQHAMAHGQGRGKHLFVKRKSGPEGLPSQEKQRRDRESWAKSRAKTGNWSSRAYNLAIQDAARWVRDEHPSMWEDFYEARCKEQRSRVAGGRLTECPHDILEQIEVTVAANQCVECRSFVGDSQIGVAPQGYAVFTGDGGRVRFHRVEEAESA